MPRNFPAPILLIILLTFFAPTVNAANNLNIFDDALNPAWQNWSWGSTINFDNPSPASSGSRSIYFDPDPWAALYLHTESVANVNEFKNFSFNLFATSQGQKFVVNFYNTDNQIIGSSKSLSNFGGETLVNSWKKYSIPVSEIGNSQVKGFAIQEISGQNQPHIFLDNIMFEAPETISTNGSGDVFLDNLAAGWQNWSWAANVNFSSEINFTPTAWGALYLHSDSGINTSNFPYLTFNLKSTQNSQKLQIGFYDSSNQQTSSFKPLSNYGGETSFNWKTYSVPINDLNAANKLIKGIALQDATGQAQQAIFIDNIKFSSQGLNQNPQPTPVPVTSSTSCPVNNSCCSQNLQKCSANGKDTSCPNNYQWCYAGYCVNENYSPLNNNCPIPQSTPTPMPVSTVVPNPTQAPSVEGYITFNNKIFQNGSTLKLKGISWFGFETGTHVVHGLWSRNWKEVIGQIKSLGFNSVRVPFCPATLKGVATTSIDASKNPDLVGLNSLQVLDKVLNEMNNQGLYILLDHHTPDCNTITPFWYEGGYSENDWINDLKFVAERYKHLSYFMGLDIKNEPHGGATWGTENAGTDWNLAAEKAGKEVLNANPNLLIFVQGIQENSNCSSNIAHWMGGNLEPFNCKPISTSAISANKLILSPHVYGPDVYFQGYFNDGNFPNNMTEIWEKHFGNLVNKGLTIVPGEWGGKYGNGGQAKDKIWQDAFVNYMKSKKICSSYYWSFNPNSGDTGGILKDDWISVWDNKMNLLKDYFNSCN